MRAMLPGGPASARGRFYQAKDVLNNPPPVQAHLPIMIGGSGERKTLHTVAKYADGWNTGGDLERVKHKDEVLRRWCDEVGRDDIRDRAHGQAARPIIRDTESRRPGRSPRR